MLAMLFAAGCARTVQGDLLARAPRSVDASVVEVDVAEATEATPDATAPNDRATVDVVSADAPAQSPCEGPEARPLDFTWNERIASPDWGYTNCRTDAPADVRFEVPPRAWFEMEVLSDRPSLVTYQVLRDECPARHCLAVGLALRPSGEFHWLHPGDQPAQVVVHGSSSREEFIPYRVRARVHPLDPGVCHGSQTLPPVYELSGDLEDGAVVGPAATPSVRRRFFTLTVPAHDAVRVSIRTSSSTALALEAWRRCPDLQALAPPEASSEGVTNPPSTMALTNDEDAPKMWFVAVRGEASAVYTIQTRTAPDV